MSERPDPLDEYLGTDSELSRAYRRHSTERTPANVDQEILSAAARTAGSRPGKRFPLHGGYLALAATVLLSLGLVRLLLQEQPSHAPLPLEPASQAEGTPATGAVPRSETLHEAVPALQSAPPAGVMRARPMRKSLEAGPERSGARQDSLGTDAMRSRSATAEQLIEEIERLKEQGLQPQAEQLLLEFRRLYPDHPYAADE